MDEEEPDKAADPEGWLRYRKRKWKKMRELRKKVTLVCQVRVGQGLIYFLPFIEKDRTRPTWEYGRCCLVCEEAETRAATRPMGNRRDSPNRKHPRRIQALGVGR